MTVSVSNLLDIKNIQNKAFKSSSCNVKTSAPFEKLTNEPEVYSGYIPSGAFGISFGGHVVSNFSTAQLKQLQDLHPDIDSSQAIKLLELFNDKNEAFEDGLNAVKQLMGLGFDALHISNIVGKINELKFTYSQSIDCLKRLKSMDLDTSQMHRALNSFIINNVIDYKREISQINKLINIYKLKYDDALVCVGLNEKQCEKVLSIKKKHASLPFSAIAELVKTDLCSDANLEKVERLLFTTDIPFMEIIHICRMDDKQANKFLLPAGAKRISFLPARLSVLDYSPSIDEQKQFSIRGFDDFDKKSYVIIKSISRDLSFENTRKKGKHTKCDSSSALELVEAFRSSEIGKELKRLTLEYASLQHDPANTSNVEAEMIQLQNMHIDTLKEFVNGPVLYKNLPASHYLNVRMGTDEDVYKNLRQIISSLLSNDNEKQNSLCLSPLGELKINFKKPAYGHTGVDFYSSSDYTWNKDGNFILNSDSSSGFNVDFFVGNINQERFLFIEDNNSSNKYIAYNGTIVRVDDFQQFNPDSFKPWCRTVSGDMQSKIFANAASVFPFKLFDENNESIIGQNAPNFNVKDVSASDIEAYYSNVFVSKKDTLTVQDILKVMPKNCMLSITPHGQEGEILYSIVCDWFSSEGTRWQLEIHSQNLKWNNSDNWIFRFNKQEGRRPKYFQFDDTNSVGYNFNGKFVSDSIDDHSHIELPSPLKNDDLLNNTSFQLIVKDISKYLFEKPKFSSK